MKKKWRNPDFVQNIKDEIKKQAATNSNQQMAFRQTPSSGLISHFANSYLKVFPLSLFSISHLKVKLARLGILQISLSYLFDPQNLSVN